MTFSFKSISAISVLLLVLFFIYGCKVYSWMILENPEFSQETRPADLSKKMKEKYAISDVIAHPRIVYIDGTQTTQKVFVAFFSKTNTAVVSIKSLELSIDSVKLDYGSQIAKAVTSPWEMYPANDPFYVCSVIAEPIPRPMSEMTQARVSVSMFVVVTDGTGHVTEKQIDAHFLPKKRSYLE